MPIPPSPTITHVVPDTSRQSWMRHPRVGVCSRHLDASWNSSRTDRMTNSAIGMLFTCALVIVTPWDASVLKMSSSYPAAGDWNHRRAELLSSKEKKATSGAPSRKRSDVPQAMSGCASLGVTAAPDTSRTPPSSPRTSHSTPSRSSPDPKAAWAGAVMRQRIGSSYSRVSRVLEPEGRGGPGDVRVAAPRAGRDGQ